MRRLAKVITVVVLGGLAVEVAGASSLGVRVVANLAVGSTRGTFSEVVDVTSARAVWKLSFSATSGKVTEARVQYVDRANGGVVGANHELCHPCSAEVSGVDHFPLPAYATSYLAAVRRGEAHVTLYTANSKAGQVAGKLKATGTSALPAAPTTSIPTVKASARYADGKVTLTLVCNAKGTATVVISDRGRPPYTSKPIAVHAGTQTVLLAHAFTRGSHSGFINIVFAAATKTVQITITVP
jgi:hypothetical protein